MRFRDEKPEDLTRARAAVAGWRDANPQGTPGQMLAAIGPAFRPEWAIVLRSVLAVIDRHQARAVTGTTGTAR